MAFLATLANSRYGNHDGAILNFQNLLFTNVVFFVTHLVFAFSPPKHMAYAHEKIVDAISTVDATAKKGDGIDLSSKIDKSG